jgi:hypothetical protein
MWANAAVTSLGKVARAVVSYKKEAAFGAPQPTVAASCHFRDDWRSRLECGQDSREATRHGWDGRLGE